MDETQAFFSTKVESSEGADRFMASPGELAAETELVARLGSVCCVHAHGHRTHGNVVGSQVHL